MLVHRPEMAACRGQLLVLVHHGQIRDGSAMVILATPPVGGAWVSVLAVCLRSAPLCVGAIRLARCFVFWLQLGNFGGVP